MTSTCQINCTYTVDIGQNLEWHHILLIIHFIKIQTKQAFYRVKTQNA